jgi:hypothetical protein
VDSPPEYRGGADAELIAVRPTPQPVDRMGLA